MSGENLREYLGDQVDWKVEDLKKWDDKICNIAKEFGLDWYPINYEICDYYEMIGHMAYHGMPSHYNHWSYGKSFERTISFTIQVSKGFLMNSLLIPILQ